MTITAEQFGQMLVLACDWAEKQERLILQNGIPLTESIIADAKNIPVEHPERVRLLSVPSVPEPDDPQLKIISRAVGLITPNTIGLTLRYGIFIRSDRINNRQLIVHELVHTAQYERFGGVEGFLREYLQQCITIGYPDAPLEQEAIKKAKSICG